MTRVHALFLALTVLGLRAEDSLLPGGESPDGRYQVRIFQTGNTDPSDYSYAVVDTKTKKQIKQLTEGGGYTRYKQTKENSTVFWHLSSTVFALTDRGTKHSTELYIYHVTPTDVTLIEQPNFYQNALGRVDATTGYMTVVTKPIKWDKDKLICSLFFDAVTHDSPRAMFTTNFSLELALSNYGAPRLAFTSMQKPDREE